MDATSKLISEITQVSQTMEEEESVFESMNAALDKQIEEDMVAINNILKANRMVSPTPPKPIEKTTVPRPIIAKTTVPRPIVSKTVPPRPIVKTVTLNKPPPKPTLTDFERIEQQIMDDEFDLYQSMNAELDKQIAKDMEAIKKFLSRAGEKIDIAKRIEFFNSMDVLPVAENHVTDHILYQHTPLGNIKWHECGQCNFKSTDQIKLKEHITEKHRTLDNGEWLTCTHCLYKTQSSSDLQSHVTQAHEEGIATCEKCSNSYDNKSSLLRHMLENHGVQMEFKCKQCPFIAEDQSSLRQHTLAEHVKLNFSWYKCAHCAYRTVRKPNLDRHIMYKHSNNKIFL